MYEQLEVKAMEETIKVREKMETTKNTLQENLAGMQAELGKLMGGKTTFKSLFSRGSKSDQIQKF